MPILLFVLMISCVLICGCSVRKLSGSSDLVRIFLFSVIGFLSVYTLISAAFFAVDRFAFVPVMICCNVAACAGALLVKIVPGSQFAAKLGFTTQFASNENVRQTLSTIPSERSKSLRNLRKLLISTIRKNSIVLLACLILIPFTYNKFELYSMGQDQGTYQVKALQLLSGDTHNYIEMTEYEKLDTDDERQQYLDFIYAQNNLYLPKYEWETDYDATHFDRIVGTIHGVPTYSALLALWGAIFGYARMFDIQTILFLCYIGLVSMICENLHLRRITNFAVTFLCGFSPIVIWLSKSTLTELFLAVTICIYLYFLTSDRHPYYTALPLILFSFIHISLFAFMPILVLISWIRYAYGRDPRELVASVLASWGFCISALWAFSIAPYYTYGNYTFLTKVTGGILTAERQAPFVVLVFLAMPVISYILHRVVSRYAVPSIITDTKAPAAEVLESSNEAATGTGCSAGELPALWQKVLAWAIRIFLVVSVLFFFYKGVLTAETRTAFEYLQISTYIYFSGLVLVPLIYIVLFLKPTLFMKKPLHLQLTLLFLYMVVVYSMIMRVRLIYYYYYARYVAVFLVLIFLLAGIIFDHFAKSEKVRKYGAAAAWIIVLVSFLPYNKGLLTQKDHTRCHWDYLAKVCAPISDRDAFVVGPDEQQILFIFPVKFLTGCDVYHADYEHLDTELARLASQYEHVYYMDYDTAFEDNWGASDTIKSLSVERVLHEENHLSNLDPHNITNPFTPIPLNYVDYKLMMSLYEISAAQ